MQRTEQRTEIERRLRAGESLRAMAPGLGLTYDSDEGALVLPGWVACDDESGVEVTYPAAGSGEEAAREYVDWDPVSDTTTWVGIRTWRTGLRQVECAYCEAAACTHDEAGDPACLDCAGEPPEAGTALEPLVEPVRIDERQHRIAVDPEEPDCSAESHDWRSPHSVVGGLRDNPGVVGHGGGVIIEEVCAHCGAYRVTDTWAQDPTDGTQGLCAVKYREPDAASAAWLERRSAQAAAR